MPSLSPFAHPNLEGENIHKSFRWEVADETARLALDADDGVVTAELYKFCLELNLDIDGLPHPLIFILVQVTPTIVWADITGVVTSAVAAEQTRATGVEATLAAAVDKTLFAGRVVKAAAYTVVLADMGKLIECTTGPWTLSLDPAATLGNAFKFGVFNSEAGVITIDANGAETIRDAAGSATTLTLAQGEAVIIVCNGTDFLAMKFRAGGAGDMLLGTGQTVTAAKTFNDAMLILAGLTSGTTTLKASAVAGTTTVTLPAATDTLVGKATTDTLTNKRITPRTDTVASSATPAINTDTTDLFTITALAAAITSMTTNLTGTPTNGEMLMIRIKDDGTARAITWGASFASRGATLPTTTVISKTLYVLLIWNSTAAVWDCISAAQEA